jgi:uncharacterized protein (TIGR02996 family)
VNEETFLSALHEAPNDEVTWLALADWLEEDGQSQRAELVRLVRQLHALPAVQVRRTNRRKTLEARIVELILAGVRPVVPEVVNSIGMRFALIGPGRFRMGAPKSERLRERDEDPHPVEITRPYYLGVAPVTQGQYEKVMGVNPSLLRAGGEREELVKGMDTSAFPVEGVSWDDAVEFCRRLSRLRDERRAGHTYRLPSEAEWEYACRAGTTAATFFGDSLDPALANIAGNYSPSIGIEPAPSLDRTCAVGTYSPNAWGVYDMHGQVWEWCQDWYDEYDLSAAAMKDPQGPPEGTRRACRGGAWMVSGDYSRSASRAWAPPEEVDSISGFRVVLVRS